MCHHFSQSRDDLPQRSERFINISPFLCVRRQRDRVRRCIYLKIIVSICVYGCQTFNLTPLAPDESARSLPAKSTRLTLLTCNTHTHTLHSSTKPTCTHTYYTCLTHTLIIHVSHTHLLCLEAGQLISAMLSEDDGKDSVWATARLIHICRCYRPDQINQINQSIEF